MRDRRHHRRTLIQHDNGMLRNRENAAESLYIPPSWSQQDSQLTTSLLRRG